MHEKMKLFIGNKTYSSWSLRGWLPLVIVKADFEEILVPLDTDEFRAIMKEASPTGCVPVLHHGTVRVWDSLAIIDYIDKLYPEANLWPKDLAAFAHARSICAEMHSGLMALRSACPMNFRRKWQNLTISKKVMRDCNRVDAIWVETRKKFGSNGDFLFGEFSAADIMFAPVVGRFDTYNLPRSETSQAYMNAVLNHPAMVQWLAAAQKETQRVEIDEIGDDATSLG